MSDQGTASAIDLDPAISACLNLMADKGWFDFSLSDVAAVSGLSLGTVLSRYGSRTSLLREWQGAVDTVLSNEADASSDESVRDGLFDTMMRRYDLLMPWRGAIRRLNSDLRRDPVLAWNMATAVERSMGVVLECVGVAGDGLMGEVRRRGLMLIDQRVVPIFCEDASVDLAPTMAALDSRLKSAERWMDGLSRWRWPGASRRQVGRRPEGAA